MIKEIKWTHISGSEHSNLTEDNEFLTKKQDGWDMIGFKEIGKKRNTWIPLGANVTGITVCEAETGRVIRKIY